jgi:hypothetical protein
MSHVATIEVDIKDIQALRTACEELGLEFMEGQKSYRCWGTGKSLDRLEKYQHISGKQLMPDGWTLSEMGQCDHAIRLKGDSQHYEIGLATRRDGKAGYQLLCDISGAHWVKEKLGEKFEKLRQGYAVEVAVRAAKRAGFRVVKKVVRSDGSVAITTQR